MSAPSWEEMEAKRQEMITSLRDVASAMTNCVRTISEYTALSPVQLAKPDLMPGALAADHQLAVALASNLTESGVGFPAALKKEKKKKEKKIKDPNAPKRPPSAYILFQNEVREEIRRSNPGINYKDILGIISAKWKELPEAQKKIYDDAYAEAHLSFRVEEEAYAKKDTEEPIVAPVEASESSSEDSSDDDSPAPAAPTLAAATEKGKKDKKRKNKEDDVASTAAVESKDKKKKKKSKD